MAIVLRTLVGKQYTPQLVPRFLDVLERSNSKGTGYWRTSSEQAAEAAKEAAAASQAQEETKAAEDAAAATSEGPVERYAGTISIDPGPAINILYGLKAILGLSLTTSPEQEDVLFAGLIAKIAWAEILELGFGPGKRLPIWYTEYLFDRAMASRQLDIQVYGKSLDLLEGTTRGQDVEADAAREAALTVITGDLTDQAAAAEAIRLDPSLLTPTAAEGFQEREKIAGAVYAAMWDVQPTGADGSVTVPTAAKDGVDRFDVSRLVAVAARIHRQGGERTRRARRAAQSIREIRSCGEHLDQG